jgi:hypothetical protein
MGGVNGDVVDQEPFVGDGEDDHPRDGAVALGDGDLPGADDLLVVVGHRAGRPPETLDVVAVRGVNELRHVRRIRSGRRPKPIAAWAIRRWHR